MPALTDPFSIGPLAVPNRVALAPLAGIGNWFIRLQAKRYGAGYAVSEMVSSHAIHHRNERTCTEMLRIDPRERPGGPVCIQLFGSDPEVMRSAAATVAQSGADAIDLNMGCPVPKVCKTGAGAALLSEPDRAVAVARAAVQGRGLPVTVKLRSGQRPGERSGLALARRLVEEAGVAAISFHPRSAAVHHKGMPDYGLAASLSQTLGAPLIITGGMRDAQRTLAAFEATGAAAVMLARGALGNPWLFQRLLGCRTADPSPKEVVVELHWTIERCCEHLGRERAARWMRKLLPLGTSGAWDWEARDCSPAGAFRKERHRRGGEVAADMELARGGAPHGVTRACGRRLAGHTARGLAGPLVHPLPRARSASLYCCPRWARHRRIPRLERGFVGWRRVHHPRSRAQMPKDVILTPEGLEKLNDELELLSTERRREVAERIKEAREFGDISENSEYDDAKNEQAMLESRIAQLQEKLRMATVIETTGLSTDVVQIGSVVHVKDEKTGKSVKYTIVGSSEAKPEQNKLSNESPVGRALLGRKRNDTVAVKVPRGPARKLKITKIDVGLK